MAWLTFALHGVTTMVVSPLGHEGGKRMGGLSPPRGLGLSESSMPTTAIPTSEVTTQFQGFGVKTLVRLSWSMVVAPGHNPLEGVIVKSRSLSVTHALGWLPTAVSVEPRRDPLIARLPGVHQGKNQEGAHEVMKRASGLKAGVTRHGCPPGYSGVIVYPLSELENELLNPMGAESEPQAVVVGGPVAVIGQPPQDEVPVEEGEIPEVGGGPGLPIGQPPQDEVPVEEGEIPEVGGPGVPIGPLQELEGVVHEGGAL
ncbi:hypothetical protein TRIUR3_12129 [Triticum urartu]|uniref:Uncharacterized protein n=1 Tax=Triticum urartu TaxID=4572 RepID=M7ZMN6_TRIUA|nr:hypothetical protein TRIUR3_12129 [Triticum urartu]